MKMFTSVVGGMLMALLFYLFRENKDLGLVDIVLLILICASASAIFHDILTVETKEISKTTDLSDTSLFNKQ